VPAGGLDFEGEKWVKVRKTSVLVDAKDLSKLFRRTFQKMLIKK
jgi:hypothetical protein